MSHEDLQRRLILEETTRSTDVDEAAEARRRLDEEDAADAALRDARERRGH